MKSAIAFGLAFLSSIISVGSALAEVPNDNGVKAALDFYFEGVRTGDVATMRKAFSADAQIHGYYDGNSSIDGPIQGLYEDLLHTGSSPDLKTRILKIEMQDTIAYAKVEEFNAVENEGSAGQSGPCFNRHFIDMDLLMKVNSRWQIISKSFFTFPAKTPATCKPFGK
jgi:Putative lumazine-binding